VQYDASENEDLAAALRSLAVCAKLGEFGMSRRLRPSGLLGSGIDSIYTAPEVAKGSRLHLASDGYSFGVLLWELMSGSRARCAILVHQITGMVCRKIDCDVRQDGNHRSAVGLL
jgi:hypothetical protein